MEHRNIRRVEEYLGGDCYGYSTECSCGNIFRGFTSEEAERKFQEHLPEE